LKNRGMPPDEVKQLAAARIFTNESGQYDIGLDKATLASDTWERDDKLATLYLSKTGYIWAPGAGAHGQRPAVDLYAENLKHVDAAVFARSSNLYGLLTGDDPFQYLGGLALAVRNLRGKSPDLYIANLRNPVQGKMESAAQSLATELRARSFHPNWIKAMQQEGYAGTLPMLESVNAFWGWQVVAPEVVRADQWQEFHAVYIKDTYDLGLARWFEKHNPHAKAQIIERMLEAVRKDYWTATPEVVAELKRSYRHLAAKFDVKTDNVKFREFVAEPRAAATPGATAGFGLAPGQGRKPPAAAQPAQAKAVPKQPTQTVQGQRLAKVDAPTPKERHREPYLLLLVALATLAGAVRQLKAIP